ncbi:hypothetical protein VC83_05103 [Pseudogymnoascus destructans]|uniref:Uncharacterized protein n=1 Tax=Pseudogymnoascus destructans TaxID=655981 RepID=A0A177A9F5_9PEZI|nr:uncharacterized protein VC83_05103 [Pseudogymnoascus destructans]OAF58749.1 hypothetical protein VC83_05103 [Pseudogymnoascus destructans]
MWEFGFNHSNNSPQAAQVHWLSGVSSASGASGALLAKPTQFIGPVRDGDRELELEKRKRREKTEGDMLTLLARAEGDEGVDF